MRHPRPEGHRFRGYLFPTLVAPLLVAVASSGQASSWQPLGPYGGAVESIAIDPSQPSTLYAGVSGVGIFKSTDGASHWEKTWLRESTSYSAVAVSWADSDRVYAATLSGFYLSDDGGQTWAPSNQGLSGTHPGRYLTALALHPSDPNTLFVGGGWGGGVAKSTNGGTTWDDSSGELAGKWVHALVIHPTTATVMYAATADDGVYKSTDGGASWAPASAGLTDLRISDLIFDPTRPDQLYATTEFNGVFKTTNGAASWSAAGTGSPTRSLRLAIDAGQPDIVYVSTWGNGVYRSTDGGQTWSQFNHGGLFAYSVVSLTVNPSGDVYAGILARGCYKRPAGAPAWVKASANMTGHRVSSLVLVPEADIVYAGESTYGERIFKSTTGGGNWTISWSGMSYPTVYALVRDPDDPNVLYSGNAGWLYKSIDGAASWAGSAEGMPPRGQFRAYSLVVDPSDPDTLYAGTDDGIYKTTNAAGQWSPVGLSGIEITALAMDGTPGGSVYAGTSRNGVSLSPDGGTTWYSASVGLPSNATVNALIVDPLDPDTLYAGTEDSGVYASIDGAKHWGSAGLAGESVDALLIVPGSPQLLVAGTRQNVLGSEDEGGTWTEMSKGLPNPTATGALAYDGQDELLYAGGDFGVFVMSLNDSMLDTDADGIPDDGDGSGTAGDLRCTGGETQDCDDNCPTTRNADQADGDLDGVGDVCDNCIEEANGPLLPDAGGNSQLDVDGDGYGNACDCDFNQDGGCGQPDYSIFIACFGKLAPASGPANDPTCEESDMNGDEGVGQPDYSLFISLFGGTPGSSGIADGSGGVASTAQAPCGLGSELVLLLPPLMWLYRRRRSRV